ncbi:lecithin retinol acyltransferase family protein [Nostoc sp. UHCC 0870]|uniref:lecithin retinol acyltransferase family protein n=1 Tax=Nostoc sp. UHCC 0870 TaxID=2914041 RepID=UPI001EE0911A|nr:lecithin retinol acyltransferase family protein [Nostoc sp. UHCC 0870]UKO98052.1 lecithin retinol acyltransferase family protein [Nostoc sp. UHCC 0870]
MRGDHVYYNCGAYSHHGINCGDGTVIHYTKSLGKISRISWADFASGVTVVVKKYGQCDTPDIVVWRAESRLEENTYDLFDNNCEHFATWCKTGLHASEQVKNAGAVGVGASGSGAAVAGSIGVVGAAGAAAGLSGAGIMSGLATVGGVVGGGAVIGIAALGLAPATVTKIAMSQVLMDDESLPDDEREARSVGRNMTTVGALAGTAGAVGTVAAAGSVAGLSAAGITSGLAAVGATVGGGMVAGVAITVAAPAAAAAAVGFGAYKLWKWISE